jgi:DNA-directed RNA polymerase specialized sigma subunit
MVMAMTVKEYLSQAYRIDQRINSKLEQVASLRELALKITASYRTEPKGTNKPGSAKENVIVKIIDLENQIDTDIDTLVDIKRDIMKVIKSVEQPEYNLLLELRYLNYKTWEEIAEIMNYSWRNVHYVHGKALSAVKLDSVLHSFAHIPRDKV